MSKSKNKGAARVIMLIMLIMVFLVTAIFLPAEVHKQVDELILKEEFDKAEQLALKALKEKPNDSETLCALACVYRNKSYKSAVKVDLSAMGLKEGEKGDYKLKNVEDIDKIFSPTGSFEPALFAKAEKIYYRIIKNDKNYVNAYLNLLNVYAQQNRFDNYFKVVDLFYKNYKQNPKAKIFLLDCAGTLFKAKQYDEAIKLYTIILKHYPEYSAAMSDLGTTYSVVGKIKKAYQLFQKAYQKDKNDPIILANLHQTYVIMEDFQNAYLFSDLLLRKGKMGHTLYFTKAKLAYLLKKDYVTPLKAFLEKERERQKTSKEKSKFWEEAALEFLEIGNKTGAEKLKFFESLLNVFYRSEYYFESIVVGNIVIEIETGKFPLMVLAAVFDRLGYFDGSIKYLDKIKEYRKEDSSIIPEYDLVFNYGVCYYGHGDYDESLKYLSANFKVRQDNAAVNFWLGKIYLEKKNLKEAKKYFELNRKLTDKEKMYYINESIRILNALK